MQKVAKKMNVWDAYVTKKNGAIMHFDIVAPVETTDTKAIYFSDKITLKVINSQGKHIPTNNVNFALSSHLNQSGKRRSTRKDILLSRWKDVRNELKTAYR